MRRTGLDWVKTWCGRHVKIYSQGSYAQGPLTKYATCCVTRLWEGEQGTTIPQQTRYTKCECIVKTRLCVGTLHNHSTTGSSLQLRGDLKCTYTHPCLHYTFTFCEGTCEAWYLYCNPTHSNDYTTMLYSRYTVCKRSPEDIYIYLNKGKITNFQIQYCDTCWKTKS